MPHVTAKIATAACVLALLHAHTDAQIPVGAGSQWAQDYLRAREGRSTEDTLRRSMIVSWVQGYVVGCALRITAEPAASEIADHIARGELPPDVDRVWSNPRVLAILQAKFGTRSGWVFDPPEAKAIETWLANYCEHHRSTRISEAAAVLANELETHSKAKQ
jgi:hypothetical protein